MLSLYNAINATSYDNLDDVIVTELEDAYDGLAIEKYSQNKESGAVGEQKVEYALK